MKKSKIFEFFCLIYSFKGSFPNIRRERSEEIVKTDEEISVGVGSEDSRSEVESNSEDENAQINSVVQVNFHKPFMINFGL